MPPTARALPCALPRALPRASRMALAASALALLPAPSAVARAASGPPSPGAILTRAAKEATPGMIYMRGGPNDRVDGGPDRTLAPYFHVAGRDAETDRLPLKETGAEVNVVGPIAHVRIKQVFANDGKQPIEAVYVFPASTRAAVHGMRIQIGGRTIVAEIQRRQDARETYEAARREGRRAGLVEQERPNVFTTSVANIMPGDRIAVTLDYSEMIVPEDGSYELVYPSVVGPRYGGGADPGRDRFIASPYLPEGQKETYGFSFAAHLETGIALKDVSSPSHRIAVSFAGPSRADVKLDEAGGGNRDVILRWRLAGDRIETGLLLYEEPHGGEKFFALQIEPPARPREAEIPAREYVFLLDVSGSMHGHPLETAKTLMKNLLGQLRPTDTFNVALFSGANFVMSPGGSLPATRANIAGAVQLVDAQHGGGGTELMGGLEAAYGIPRGGQNVSRSVVVVTDGYVGVEAQAFRFVREHLDEANCFAFGIGSGVNRALIEGLARAGQGEPFVVLRPEKAREAADRLQAMIATPVLAGIHVATPGFAARDVSPGHLPDLLARRPVVLFGKYDGPASGRIEITGHGGAGPFRQIIEVAAAAPRTGNEALRWLWARRWVGTLEDERHLFAAKSLEEGITELGLSYGLLTPFTSFVAVDSQIANRGGPAGRVDQPLPLPEGVSNMAVGQPSAGAAAGGYGLGSMGTRHGSGGASYGMASGGAWAAKSKRSPALDPSATTRGRGAAGASLDDLRSAKAGGKAVDSKEPAPVSVAAASPAAPPPARVNAQSAHANAEIEKDESGARPQRTGVHFAVAGLEAEHLGDLHALTDALEAKLAGLAGCGEGSGPIKLRLHVDGSGRVVRIEVIAGAQNAACLVKALGKLESATRASGAATGTLVLTLRAIR